MEENSTIVNYKKYIDDNILAKPAWLNEVTSTCISLFFFMTKLILSSNITYKVMQTE